MDDLSYLGAIALLKLAINGEKISEEQLNCVLQAYPEIGRELNSLLTLKTSPSWSVDTVRAMAKAKREALIHKTIEDQRQAEIDRESRKYEALKTENDRLERTWYNATKQVEQLKKEIVTLEARLQQKLDEANNFQQQLEEIKTPLVIFSVYETHQLIDTQLTPQEDKRKDSDLTALSSAVNKFIRSVRKNTPLSETEFARLVKEELNRWITQFTNLTYEDYLNALNKGLIENPILVTSDHRKTGITTANSGVTMRNNLTTRVYPVGGGNLRTIVKEIKGIAQNQQEATIENKSKTNTRRRVFTTKPY